MTLKLTTLLAVLLFMVQSIAAQEQKAITPPYNFPPGIVEEKKAEFVQLCEKGKTLYKIHCSRCHTTTVEEKEVIPDFTPMQLDMYDMRLGFTKHQSTLTEKNIPEEELELIIFFLTHKKTKKQMEEMEQGAEQKNK
jgi:hypothetical protein